MKKAYLFPVILFAIICCSFAGIALQNWALGETFSVKFINPEATGTFDKMTADISFSETDPGSSKFDVVVDVSSVNLGNPEMNKEVLSNDMLYVRRYPTIHFLSSEVSKTPNGYLLKGTLDLHGVKKEIAFPFTFKGAVFNGSFEIKAKDYGINSLGNGQEDILRIELNVPVKEK